MENRPHISIWGTNIPSDIEDRFMKWHDAAYAPAYAKLPGHRGVDNYTIVKRSLVYPGLLSIFHRENRKAVEESRRDPHRIAIQKDFDATFYRLEWVWHDIYALIGGFRNDSTSRDSSVVENAPIIHIEGYRVPPAEQERYDQWFTNSASRIYIPLIMETPGLIACNCFKLSDFSVRWPGHTYLQAEIAPYVSILYFENMESFENYQVSLRYAALKRSMEVELPPGVSTIWNVQYQLRKSFRK